MFNKLKQLKGLRDQAKKMQNALSSETVTTEKNGIVITMDGNMQVNGVKVNAETNNKEALASAIKDAVNDAIKQTQKLMAKKMQEMGGFPGLK